MKYRVVFRDRSDESGDKADEPANFLDNELPDDVVVDAVMVGRIEPDAQHGSDRLEEDDAFLSESPEIWEYDVAEGRDQEFIDALRNSGVVMEYEALESEGELGVT
jgi:hypothetical protein